MDETKINRIKWFLGFVNLQIGELSSGDRIKWINETIKMLEFGDHNLKLTSRYVTHDRISIKKKVSLWVAGNKFEACHKSFKKWFYELMDNVKRSFESRLEISPEEILIMPFSFAKLETETTILLQYPYKGSVGSIEDASDDMNEVIDYPYDKTKFYQRPFHLTFRSKNDQEGIILAFLVALYGVQIGSIRKCPICDKWFLHTSKRVKIFCSNRCAIRKASKDRRIRLKSDNPEEYKKMLRENAKRARKSYERKVPLGKPKRRPYKYKGETVE